MFVIFRTNPHRKRGGLNYGQRQKIIGKAEMQTRLRPRLGKSRRKRKSKDPRGLKPKVVLILTQLEIKTQTSLNTARLQDTENPNTAGSLVCEGSCCASRRPLGQGSPQTWAPGRSTRPEQPGVQELTILSQHSSAHRCANVCYPDALWSK